MMSATSANVRLPLAPAGAAGRPPRSGFALGLAASLALHAGLAGGLLGARRLGWLDAAPIATPTMMAASLGIAADRPLIVNLPDLPPPPAPEPEPEPKPAPPKPDAKLAAQEPEPVKPKPVESKPLPKPAPPTAMARPSSPAAPPTTIIDVTQLGKDTDRPPTDAFLESLRTGEHTGPKFTADQAALTRNAGAQRAAEAPTPNAAAPSATATGLPGEPGLPGPVGATPPPPTTPTAPPPPAAQPQTPTPPAPTTPPAPPTPAEPPVVVPPREAAPPRAPLPPGVGVEAPLAPPPEAQLPPPPTPLEVKPPPAVPPADPKRPLTGLFSLPRLNELPRRPAEQPSTKSPAPDNPNPQPTATGQGGANGQRAGGSRRLGEAGDQSDRDSPIAAVAGRPELRAGRVVVGAGLEVRTSRINLETLERFLVGGQVAVVDIYFRKDGTVRDVAFIQATGALDEPILNALYRWRAAGKDLARLPDPALDPQAAVRVRMKITLD